MKKKRNKVQVAVYFEQGQIDQLRKHSKLTGVPVAELIRRCANIGLARIEKTGFIFAEAEGDPRFVRMK
jgi:hypothetical protein